MMLNSNSNISNFLLIWTVFLALWHWYIYSHKRKEKSRQILDFSIDCCKISRSLLTNFASPEKWSMQGICNPSPLPKFTLLPIISAPHYIIFINCTWKTRNGFGETWKPSFRIISNHITTSFNDNCVFVILFLWFWSSFENCSIFGSPHCHASMITFDMSFQIVFLDQKYW